MVALLPADPGVTKSHIWPHVSKDSLYSEAQFKTFKYRPDFPSQFGSQEDARQFCQLFFPWYNQEHWHSGIGFYPPADIHLGRAYLRQERRAEVLDAAWSAHPEPFVDRPPAPPQLPPVAWSNRSVREVA